MSFIRHIPWLPTLCYHNGMLIRSEVMECVLSNRIKHSGCNEGSVKVVAAVLFEFMS